MNIWGQPKLKHIQITNKSNSVTISEDRQVGKTQDPSCRISILCEDLKDAFKPLLYLLRNVKLSINTFFEGDLSLPVLGSILM